MFFFAVWAVACGDCTPVSVESQRALATTEMQEQLARAAAWLKKHPIHFPMGIRDRVVGEFALQDIQKLEDSNVLSIDPWGNRYWYQIMVTERATDELISRLHICSSGPDKTRYSGDDLIVPRVEMGSED